MLVVDSEKRYSIAQIVQHPWMKQGLDDTPQPGSNTEGAGDATTATTATTGGLDDSTTANLTQSPAVDLEGGGAESEDEECGVIPDSELGQQILSHMTNLGLDKDAVIQVSKVVLCISGIEK